MNRAVINADEGDSDFEEDDETKQYIYMELESKSGSLSNIDIDAMFNATSVEDFMHGISRRGTFNTEMKDQPKKKATEDAKDLISSIMSGKKDVFADESEKGVAPELDFNVLKEEQEANKEGSAYDNEEELRNRAMANLRERRMRLK